MAKGLIPHHHILPRPLVLALPESGLGGARLKDEGRPHSTCLALIKPKRISNSTSELVRLRPLLLRSRQKPITTSRKEHRGQSRPTTRVDVTRCQRVHRAQ